MVQCILSTKVVWQRAELDTTINLILHTDEDSSKGEVNSIVITNEGTTVCASVTT
jgi:hypothetical protein